MERKKKTLMELLPKDMRMNIFSRLPSKSLGKSNCVCKEWKNLISDPFFKFLYRERSSKKPYALLVRQRDGIDYTVIDISSVDFDDNLNFDRTFTVRASVYYFLPSKGDLICLFSNIGVHVCNPRTGELVDLAKRVCFGFAFGYIKETNEYVLFVPCSGGVEILRWTDNCCLKDLPWKVVNAECPCVVRSDAVMVENCFYWIELTREESDELLIVLFDLGKEEFGTFMPPPFDPNKVQDLVELKGMLCLVDSPVDISIMDIWVLKELINYTWVKEYTIDLGMFNVDFLTKVIPLYHREGKFLMDVPLIGLVWYDMENNNFERIHNSNGTSLWYWSGIYTEGLFSFGSI